MMRDERDDQVVRRGTYALHAWLDGDGSEWAARRAAAPGAREVELWKRVEAEAARRRSEHAPEGLRARILAALPAEPSQPAPPRPRESSRRSKRLPRS
ncbi:MAG TPA: hypothetical protein VKA84_04460 [Gemmatimonadaceae bacterium]|nr:hypothetical protein [Gemmatimonadaceae bacterium]